MDANLRSVSARPAEEAEVGETAPSFEEFYEASFRRLLPALCLISGNRFEAEEVAQEAFVRVFERWDRVGMLEDPTGYLFRVSMNVSAADTGEHPSLFVAPSYSRPRRPTTSPPSRPMTQWSACSWDWSPSRVAAGISMERTARTSTGCPPRCWARPTMRSFDPSSRTSSVTRARERGRRTSS
jgi:hypothetical protein